MAIFDQRNTGNSFCQHFVGCRSYYFFDTCPNATSASKLLVWISWHPSMICHLFCIVFCLFLFFCGRNLYTCQFFDVNFRFSFQVLDIPQPRRCVFLFFGTGFFFVALELFFSSRTLINLHYFDCLSSHRSICSHNRCLADHLLFLPFLILIYIWCYSIFTQ